MRILTYLLHFLKLPSSDKLPENLDEFYAKLIREHYHIDPNDQKGLSIAVEIYKTYYAQTFVLPGQRLTTHGIFLTVNTLFSSIVGYLMINHFTIWTGWQTYKKIGFLLAPYSLILFFCYLWFRLLAEYDNLAYAFIMLTKAMEENLPIRPLTMLFQATNKFSLNHGPSRLTKALPILFACVYLTMFIYIFTN